MGRTSSAFRGRAGFLAALVLFAGGNPAQAADTPETGTWIGYADFDLAAADGPRAWLGGGTGKGRFGNADGSDLRVRPYATEAGLVWQPHFSWALSGLVSGIAQQGQDKAIDLSEAYLRYKPLPLGNVRLGVRAGLFWPPVSLEHAGGEWPVTETVTPSAINSWIGEEVKVGGIEANASTMLGAHRLSFTFAAFGLNDTAGTLLTFRGWALHDEKATAFSLQPLPRMNDFMRGAQAGQTRPTIEIDGRPGWYAKFGWAPPGPFELSYVHYDNRGDPQAVNAAGQWGWRTRFDHFGAILDLNAQTRLTTQAISGATIMGFRSGGRRWVDMRYRSAFLLATRQVTMGAIAGAVSGRVEAFDTRNTGSKVTTDDDETGWAATVATRWPLLRHVTCSARRCISTAAAMRVCARASRRASMRISCA